jgi:uncharacterized membrane protein YfcA
MTGNQKVATSTALVLAALLLLLATVSWNLTGLVAVAVVVTIVIGAALVAFLTARLVSAAREEDS